MDSSGPQPAPASASQAFKQQQQELVKLLTQHFHFQFYRMATNAQSVQGEQQLTAPYHQPAASVLVSPTGYHGMQYPLGASVGSQIINNGFDLSPQQNASSAQGSQHQNQHKLPNANTQQLTSNRLQTTTANNHTSTISASNKPLADNPLLAMDPQTPVCSLSEINLFNALGLSNLTNNQLVLSLQQQQSLLQASAAAASAIPQGITPVAQDPFCILNDTYNLHPTTFWPASKRSGAGARSRTSTEEAIRNQTRHPQQQHRLNSEHSDEGKEMLKFSINTILGSGSAKNSKVDNSQRSPCGVQDTPHHLYDQPLDSTNNPFAVAINHEMKSTINKEMAHQQAELRSINCDHRQLDSDDCSGSLNQSPTPEAGSSILFNNDDSDHPSANTQHMNGFVADHQQQARLHNQNHIQHPFLSGSSVFPWAVATRGKPRRGMMRRAVFSDGQRVGLEKRFQLQKYISKPDRKKLAEKLGLRDSQVKIWFQNRRMKWRNSKERELLSAGGSREQTLPTRSNPNPDLSDVGETIKRLTGGGGTTIES